MAKYEGWIKLNRQLLENPIWTDEPFTRGQAWVDLILMANHEDGVGKKGDVIPPGSLVTSYAALARRWHWSVGKVRRYLGTLTGTQMISRTGTRSGTLLTIVKYDFYQGVRHTNRHTNRHTGEQTDGQPTRNNKEIKEEKNSRSRSSYTPLGQKMGALEERRERLKAEQGV